MARVREMQGTPAHLVTLKSNDGRRRHPSRCIFATRIKGERICTSPQCSKYNTKCTSSSKCDFYEENKNFN